MRKLICFDVFVSCPNDVQKELHLIEGAASELNVGYRQQNDPWHINIVHQGNATFSSIGETGQAVIEEQIGKYDVYIGLIWNRFGTPTMGFGSGTEREFHCAIEMKNKELCRELAFLRKTVEPKFDRKDTAKAREALDQLDKCTNFVNKIRESGVLTKDFRDDPACKKEFVGIINNVISKYKREISPQATSEKIAASIPGFELK